MKFWKENAKGKRARRTAGEPEKGLVCASGERERWKEWGLERGRVEGKGACWKETAKGDAESGFVKKENAERAQRESRLKAQGSKK